jgi:acylpyruvate hydrolase
MRLFLEAGEQAWETAAQLLELVEERLPGGEKELIAGGLLYPKDQVRLRPPVPDPQKIIAIGLNYIDHCQEQGVKLPKEPVIFAKYPSALIGPGEPITWPAGLTAQVDYEAELAVVIGRRARAVPAERAFDYVAGYTILNDVSARDLQFADKQWVRAKSLDTFCPLGPALVSKDEVGDPHQLKIRCYLNGKLVQDSTTANLIFDIPYLVSFLSQAFTLVPGDIIATGTPGGVGVFRRPQIFLKAGDLVEAEVERLGILSNPVGGPQKEG